MFETGSLECYLKSSIVKEGCNRNIEKKIIEKKKDHDMGLKNLKLAIGVNLFFVPSFSAFTKTYYEIEKMSFG